MERIRAALVITELNIGGAERCLVDLATGLDRSRFDPCVFALARRPRGEQGALAERLDAADMPVEFIGATSVWQFPLALGSLRKRLALRRPHVVQSFLFHADVLVSLALPRRPRPRHVLGFRVSDPTRWRQRVRRRVARRADRVVCVSNAVARFARERVGVPDEKLVVIHNGVENPPSPVVPAFDWTVAGVPAGRSVILCVARLHRQKGLDWLLQTLPALLQRWPNHDLVLVGDGPEEAALRAQATTLAIADRVHFLGWRSDVARLLRASSLLVLTSRWEGLPNAVLEAMAAGLPVVAARTDGVVELLGDDPLQTFDWGDVTAFQNAVDYWLQDPDAALQIGAQNQQRARDDFSVERMVRSYESLYAALVLDHAQKAP